jgi:hypothetical protein
MSIKSRFRRIRIVRLILAYFRARSNHYIEVKQNINDFKKASSFIKKIPDTIPNGKTVLVISLSSFLYSVKLEIMLALGLKLAGWNIVFLCKETDYWTLHLIRWSGLGKVILLEDYYYVSNNLEVKAEKYLEGRLDFPSIKSWKYKNAWIGPQILSYLSRLSKIGSVNLASEKSRVNLKKTVRETLLAVEIAELICNLFTLDLCLVNEPNYAFNGGIVDTLIARKIPVIHYLQPSKDNALIFKKLTLESRRVHPASVSASAFKNIIKETWTESHEALLNKEFQLRYDGSNFLQSRNQQNVVSMDKERIAMQLGIPKDVKIACIFCPVLWDANLFYGEDLFDDFGDWLDKTVKAAADNANLVWLIKLHPANLWKLARENNSQKLSDFDIIHNAIGKKLPLHMRILEPDCGISTFSLFCSIDYGVTVRGTTGMELPCFGKPTFLAGTGRYSGLGFTIDSSTSEEYLSRLAEIQYYSPMTKEQVILAKKHALAAFKRRAWVMKSFRATFNYQEKGSHPLDHDLHPVAKSIEDIQHNKDLIQWTEWAGDDKLDFLSDL